MNPTSRNKLLTITTWIALITATLSLSSGIWKHIQAEKLVRSTQQLHDDITKFGIRSVGAQEKLLAAQERLIRVYRGRSMSLMWMGFYILTMSVLVISICAIAKMRMFGSYLSKILILAGIFTIACGPFNKYFKSELSESLIAIYTALPTSIPPDVLSMAADKRWITRHEICFGIFYIGVGFVYGLLFRIKDMNIETQI